MRSSMLCGLALAVGLVGCANKVQVKKYKPAVKVVPAPPADAKPLTTPRKAPPKVVAAPQRTIQPTLPKRLETVYFDFNKYTLTAAAKQQLQEHVVWLRKHRKVQVKISGHCDQRGSVEYNLLLGERRAKAIKRYLGLMGIAEARLTIISYGHQRPAATGHTTAAHAKNRRGEFHIVPQ